jgi:putative two-component system response regulator
VAPASAPARERALGATALGWLARGDAELVAHSLRTARLSAVLSRSLGWSEIAARQIERAAVFHDIGKTLLPPALLAKPDPLTPEELELIRQHTTWGASLLSSLEQVPALAREIALHHHERWDGTGYPHGLAGLDIPEPARIVAVADAYDALTGDRSYREPIAPEAALELLCPDSGAQFDSAVLDVLAEALGSDPSRRPC